MTPLTQERLEVLLKFVRGFYACHDRDAFISYLLYGISSVIPAESTAFAEIDSEGRVVDLRVEPVSGMLSGFRQLFELYLPQHPHVRCYQRAGDASAVKLSDFLTKRQLHTLKLYSELYKPIGVEHVMSVSLPGPGSRVLVVSLHRSRRDFTERERFALNLLRPHLGQAYENTETIRLMRQEVVLLSRIAEAKGYGIIFLTKDGRVRFVSGRVRQWLTDYFRYRSQHRDCLPEVVGSWLRHQEHSLEIADDAPLRRKPFIVKGEAGSLIIRHLCEADRCILLMEEQCQTSQPAPLRPFGLSCREAEVLSWVAQGKTNADIASILGLSSRTVQKHLEHIFKKLGVETRVAATRALSLGSHRKR